MDIQREWYKSEFLQHELMFEHRKLENEFSFYVAVATGNLEYVKENCSKKVFSAPDGMGQLSDDNVQNLRYHFVVTATMITRYCVHDGMGQEKAYGLSDFYIQKMDKCKSVSEIAALHDKMCLDFCQKMLTLKSSERLSKPVVLSLDYIYRRIHTRITVKELAAHLNLSESYLSKLFHKEMGIPVSDYILNIKIDKAKNMLQYSDYSIVDIANYLAFSSQSHFIQVFSKKTGTTPHKYRTRFFRSNWQGSSPRQK